MGEENGVTLRLEEAVRVDEAFEGARDRFEKESTLGLAGRDIRGVPDGVGEVARIVGSGAEGAGGRSNG